MSNRSLSLTLVQRSLSLTAVGIKSSDPFFFFLSVIQASICEPIRSSCHHKRGSKKTTLLPATSNRTVPNLDLVTNTKSSPQTSLHEPANIFSEFLSRLDREGRCFSVASPVDSIDVYSNRSKNFAVASVRGRENAPNIRISAQNFPLYRFLACLHSPACVSLTDDSVTPMFARQTELFWPNSTEGDASMLSSMTHRASTTGTD